MTDKLAHQKDVQGALSLTGATLGLGALGSKGASMAIDRAAKKPAGAHAKPRMILTPKVARALDKGSLGLVTAGAGVGGISGYNFAAIQRAEAKRERESMSKADTKKKPLNAAERKERRGAMIGGSIVGTTTAAAAPLLSESARKPTSRGYTGRYSWDNKPEGVGRRTSRYFQRKAAPRGGRPADPGAPPTPPKPPLYEETLGNGASDKARFQYKQANERIIYLREHPIDHEGKSTKPDLDASEAFKERLHQKYGSTKGRQIHPGTPGDPGRPAKPAVPPKKAPWGWRAAHATMGGPKRTTAILGAGLLAAGAGAGVGMGVASARGKRKERQERKIMFGKNAFGVSKAEDPYEKYNRALAAGHRPKPLGEPDPHDWKSDLQRQPAPPKAAPREYPKTGGIDPERKRLRRMGHYEDAMATGAVASGLAAGGIAGSPKALTHTRRTLSRKAGEWEVRANQKSHKRKYVKVKTRERFGRASAAAYKMRDVADNAHLRLAKVPTGKIALATAGVGAGLAGGTVAMRQYRKKNGRSYSDWWDG